MEFLPIEGELGIPIGRLLLKDEYVEMLRQGDIELRLTVIYNRTTDKAMGYRLSGVPAIEKRSNA